MKSSPRADHLPPYFNIDPDWALAQLNAPITTAGFDNIARDCQAGRDDLASRGLEENGEEVVEQEEKVVFRTCSCLDKPAS